MARNDLQGTLDLLVLKTLSQTGELHGYGIDGALWPTGGEAGCGFLLSAFKNSSTR